ncbi:MAG: hypothetical protein CMH91_10160 [Oceanicaulis sp.]|jgi:hypothetical protein|uniref:hypothetical protein n=1 Tax=unclassified Oceanicaulis TaxID=2632123 RepID=UPI000066BBBE|nr:MULTISPECIES: hypothetical protein [unclassified Oceanicaulis]EAP89110.1 hypothetical protein OA2633_14571 [Oceanicaulis alexandrii HTCC2633] [Oceanicaulis sp. HTCC2633]MBC39407.1 hypothetical protein [Oceanicaulis sp.]MBG35108.1 hypothetical protein [Oceanicaulis sp.]HBU63721.1 hypothetical protein [Oceanicaulis sp.]|tara:strand:- start:2828 stop:3442 length:615 start_codon:yes stop_codon:yes gene_type:complete
MHLRPLAAAFVLLGAGFPALAQDVRTDSDTLNSLLACRAIGDDAARLACQDEQLDALAQATEAGRVVVVERQALRQVEREGFGLNLPSMGRLGAFLRGSDAERVAAADSETFEDGSIATYNAEGSLEALTGLPVETVERVRGKLRVTLANGQVWAQTDSTRLPTISDRDVRNGLTAEIESGLMGAHFMSLSSNTRRRFRAERIR